MTFSIVARDDKTGAFGACGYTDIASYGAIVPHVSLRGAAATQAYVNVDNGLEVMQLLDAGQDIESERLLSDYMASNTASMLEGVNALLHNTSERLPA